MSTTETTNKEKLKVLQLAIDKLEKSDVEVVKRERFDEHFIYFIMAALFFLFIEQLLKYTLLRTFP